MAGLSDEHDENFQQVISQTEKRYSGKWSKHIFADFYWRRKGNTNWRKKGQKEVKGWLMPNFFLGHRVLRHYSWNDTEYCN